MNVARLTFNPIQENTYIVWDDTKECIIIDAGNFSAREDAALTDFLNKHDLRPTMAVNTHGHFDHAMGVAYVKETYNVPFACSMKDSFLIEKAVESGMMFGVKCAPVPAIDIDLDATDVITFGNTTLQVIKTPGHTPGHVALYNAEHKMLFTGDTLFRESIGRTDLPGGDYSWIMRSILEQILPLGDETTIYPGHGDKSDLGHETLYNPFITEVLNNEINYKG